MFGNFEAYGVLFSLIIDKTIRGAQNGRELEGASGPFICGWSDTEGSRKEATRPPIFGTLSPRIRPNFSYLNF